NRPLDLAEADAIAVALAPPAHDEAVAVFQEGALGAAGQFDRLGTVPGNLQQAAALVLLGAGDRAGAEEITDIHGAAGGSVVHQLLHRGPVHVFEIGAADARRGIRAARAQRDIELDIVVLRPGLLEIVEWHRRLRRAQLPERLQRLTRDDPGADRGR